jgi:hypothetical protein
MGTAFGDIQGNWNWKVKGTELTFTNLMYLGQQVGGWQTGWINGNTITISGANVWVKH